MSIGVAGRVPGERRREKAAPRSAKALRVIEWLARCGFVTKGLVYGLIGILALETALGFGDKTTDFTGLLQVLLQQPFGRLILGILAVGFLGYALWRGAQAILYPGGRGSTSKEWLYRIAYAISGATYGVLALTALRMLSGLHTHLDGRPGWALRLLAQPIGPWIMAAVGICVLGLGLHFLHHAYTAQFREELMLHRMSAAEKHWVTLAGRIGHAARGMVFCLGGYFLLQAALHANPREARGLKGVLHGIGEHRFGAALLGMVAAGLLIYGAYMLVATRYRQVWA